jgi:hypothetical protein
MNDLVKKQTELVLHDLDEATKQKKAFCCFIWARTQIESQRSQRNHMQIVVL